MIKGKTKEDGKAPARPYTPTTLDMDKGSFELVIKSYPQGNVSSYLCSLEAGDEIEVKGPFPKIKYECSCLSLSYSIELYFKIWIDLNYQHWMIEEYPSRCYVILSIIRRYEANMKRKLGMIAGGSGITPMLQVGILKSIFRLRWCFLLCSTGHKSDPSKSGW